MIYISLENQENLNQPINQAHSARPAFVEMFSLAVSGGLCLNSSYVRLQVLVFEPTVD